MISSQAPHGQGKARWEVGEGDARPIAGEEGGHEQGARQHWAGLFLAGSQRPRQKRPLRITGSTRRSPSRIRKVGDLTPEQVEQDVARVPRLAVASIEDGSDHVIRGQDIEKATVLDIVSDGGW